MNANTVDGFSPVWPPVLGLLGSGLTAVLMVIRQGGFGAGDLPSLFFWLIPFTLITTIVSLASAPLIARTPPFAKYILAALCGILFSVLLSFGPILCLGPWAAAFSFPFSQALITGGVIIFVSSVMRKTASTRNNLPIALGLMVTLSLCFTFLFDPILAGLTGYRDVKLTFVRWQPYSEFQGIEDHLLLLSQAERESLVELHLPGHLIIEGEDARGTGLPGVEILIIMQAPLDHPVVLFNPLWGRIIYIQEENGWRKIPAYSWTTPKGVKLFQWSANVTAYQIDYLGGGIFGR